MIFRFKSFLGFRTTGLTQFKSLALNRILERLPKGLFTIGIVREDDFSDSNIDRLQKWSLKSPENHISLFLQPESRSGKLLIGENWIEKFDTADVKEKLDKVNLLFADEQYLKGVDFLVNFVRAKL